MEYKAISIGRNSKQVNEFLEKNYKEGQSKDESLKLVAKALLDVVESGSKNIDLVLIERGLITFLKPEEVDAIVSKLS